MIIGDLDFEERAKERLVRMSVPSPFDYASHMRVVALRGGTDLVRETADVLELLARQLGGRTLGLFTSLRRMDEVADELAARLRSEGIDVIAPRRGSDDPSALVQRVVNGAGVLLGARRFWQGIDIPGDALQAVVIDKLPFEVPTELRRRREARLAQHGVSAFERLTLGRMLLNLKQMVGRLIRTEDDRGIVVIVEGRAEKGYFRRLRDALPKGSEVVVSEATRLGELIAEVGIPTEPRSEMRAWCTKPSTRSCRAWAIRAGAARATRGPQRRRKRTAPLPRRTASSGAHSKRGAPSRRAQCLA